MVWMPVALPDPPAPLTGAAREFSDELREMLAVVAPTQVDASKTSVVFDDDSGELEFTHTERSDWCIWAMVGDRDAIAGTSWAHEHFFPSRGTPDERPWTTQIVDFVAEILPGGDRNRDDRTSIAKRTVNETSWVRPAT